MAFTPLYLTHIATLPRRAALAGHAAAMAALAGAVPLGHMLAARHGAAPLLLSTCALAALFAAPAFMLSGLGVGAVAWIAQLVLAIALGLHLGGLTDALVQGLPRQVRKTALLDLRWCCTCCSHLMGWSLLLLLLMMLMTTMMMHSTQFMYAVLCWSLCLQVSGAGIASVLLAAASSLIGGGAPLAAMGLVQITGSPISPALVMIAGAAVSAAMVVARELQHLRR